MTELLQESVACDESSGAIRLSELYSSLQPRIDGGGVRSHKELPDTRTRGDLRRRGRGRPYPPSANRYGDEMRDVRAAAVQRPGRASPLRAIDQHPRLLLERHATGEILVSNEEKINIDVQDSGPARVCSGPLSSLTKLRCY